MIGIQPLNSSWVIHPLVDFPKYTPSAPFANALYENLSPPKICISVIVDPAALAHTNVVI